MKSAVCAFLWRFSENVTTLIAIRLQTWIVSCPIFVLQSLIKREEITIANLCVPPHATVHRPIQAHIPSSGILGGSCVIKWEIGSWCRQVGIPVWQHYADAMSVHYDKSVLVLIWPAMFSRRRPCRKKNYAMSWGWHSNQIIFCWSYIHSLSRISFTGRLLSFSFIGPYPPSLVLG